MRGCPYDRTPMLIAHIGHARLEKEREREKKKGNKGKGEWLTRQFVIDRLRSGSNQQSAFGVLPRTVGAPLNQPSPLILFHPQNFPSLCVFIYR